MVWGDLKAARRASFPLEAFPNLRGVFPLLFAGTNELHHRGSVEEDVFRGPDLAHRALAERLDEGGSSPPY